MEIVDFCSWWHNKPVEEFPYRWFHEKETNKFHFFFEEMHVGYYDSENHYDDGFINRIEIENKEYSLVYLEDGEIIRVRTSYRVIGEINFNHWRLGKSTHIGI